MVKTTYEMDGLYTEQDIARRYSVFLQCAKCRKWTKTDSRHKENKCQECGADSFDIQSITSERTFDPVRAAKRKIKAK